MPPPTTARTGPAVRIEDVDVSVIGAVSGYAASSGTAAARAARCRGSRRRPGSSFQGRSSRVAVCGLTAIDTPGLSPNTSEKSAMPARS